MRALFARLARRDRSGPAAVLLEGAWLGALAPESAAQRCVLAPAPALPYLPSTSPAAEAPCTSGAALPLAVRWLLVPEGLWGLATSAERQTHGGAGGRSAGRSRKGAEASSSGAASAGGPTPQSPSRLLPGSEGRGGGGQRGPRLPSGDRGASAAAGIGTGPSRGRRSVESNQGSDRRSRDSQTHRSASAPPPQRGREAESPGRGRSSSAPPPSSRGGRGPNPIPAIKACWDLGQLEALVEAEAGAWSRKRDAYAIVAVLNLAAMLPSPDTAKHHRVFSSLAAAYLPLVEGLPDAAGCTIPLHACAKAGYWGVSLAAALIQRLSRKGGVLVGTAKQQDHANLWWSLSKTLDSAEGRQVLSSIDLPRLLEASAECLLAMPITDSQHCSNILIACARLKLSNKRLTHDLTARLVELGAEAGSQHLANSLYALGELAEDVGHTPRPGDLQSLAWAVLQRLALSDPKADIRKSFIPQHLANMLLGCARLGYTDPGLLRPLTAAAGGAAPRMNPQQLANSLYSLTLLKRSVSAQRGAVEALARECRIRRFSGFKPQELSNSAWALATMGHADQGCYAAAVEAAGQPGSMQGGTPQNWSNLWYALALVRHQPASGRLLERTAETAAMLRQGAEPQHCANLLWALANLRLYDERLVDALAGRLGELLGQDPEQLTGQHLCNSLWALAVMGPDVLSRHSGLVEGLLCEVERRWAVEGGGALSSESLPQLWYAQLELAHMGGSELQRILGAGEGRQGSLLGAARAAARESAARRAAEPPSDTERQVASALERQAERLGPGTLVSVQRGCVVPGLGRAVDIVVELSGGRRVAVEVDGPSHFFANRPRDPTAVDGRTELRNRQLGRVSGAGNVLSVLWWEWDDCKTEAQQEGLLSGLLELKGVCTGGGPQR